MKELKIKIQVEKKYKITIGDKVHSGFSIESEMDGITKFRSEEGIIIAEVDDQRDLISEVMGLVSRSKFDAPNGVGAIVYKMSPCLFPVK